ncbi:MAG: hypothetical protein WCJ07_04780 [Verrucomicrobiota bacterium]
MNHLKYPDALVIVAAGYELLNSLGQPVSAANIASAVPALALSAQNLVTDVTLAGSSDRLLLVNYSGKIQLDANGNPIYVSQLMDGNGQIVFTDGSTVSAQTFSKNGLALALVNSAGKGLLGSDGNQIFVVQVMDAMNDPKFVIGRNINAAGSGIIASNAKLYATGNIRGVVFTRNNLNITSLSTVDVTALSGGKADVSGKTITGTIVALDGISTTSDNNTSKMISESVTGSTSGQSGLGTGGAANATANAASASDDSSKVAKKPEATGEDDTTKKKTKGIALAQKVSRVTVLLPSKN